MSRVTTAYLQKNQRTIKDILQPMIAAAIRAMRQVFQPAFRAIFWKSLGFTLALLFAAASALSGLVSLMDSGYTWLDASFSVVASVGLVIGAGYLIAPVTAVFATIYQDDVALIVEREDYAADGPGRAMPFSESIWLTVKFTGIVILANIFALMLLLVPGINLVAFFLVNGYLLGREFFEFAAMRFMPHENAKALRKAHGGTVFLAGLVIAGVLAVPILNLVTPIFATIFMVHLYKLLARGEAAATGAPPYRSV